MNGYHLIPLLGRTLTGIEDNCSIRRVGDKRRMIFVKLSELTCKCKQLMQQQWRSLRSSWENGGWIEEIPSLSLSFSLFYLFHSPPSFAYRSQSKMMYLSFHWGRRTSFPQDEMQVVQTQYISSNWRKRAKLGILFSVFHESFSSTPTLRNSDESVFKYHNALVVLLCFSDSSVPVCDLNRLWLFRRTSIFNSFSSSRSFISTKRVCEIL